MQSIRFHFVLLLVVICAISGILSDDDPIVPDAGKIPEPRLAQPRSICDVRGCGCANDYKKLECKCESADFGHNPLKFGAVTTIPPTIETFSISDCTSVDFGNRRFSTELPYLRELSFSSVKRLRFQADTLGKMNSLSVEDVGDIFIDKGALSQLEAENVRFVNANFSNDETSDSVFKPKKIDGKVEFTGCSLSKQMAINLETSRPDFVIFHDCRFNKLRVKAKAISFEMTGNHFDSISDQHAIEVGYFSSFNVQSNNHLAYSLPNVRSGAPKAINADIILNERRAPRAVQHQWIRSFLFTYDDRRSAKTGALSEAHCNQTRISYDSQNYTRLNCASVKGLEEFMATSFESLPFVSGVPLLSFLSLTLILSLLVATIV